MELKCVFESDDRYLLLSAKELLESNDIVCMMPNEHLTGIVPYFSLATGGMKLFVSVHDYEDAMRILEVFECGAVESVTSKQVTEYNNCCPKCNSLRTAKVIIQRRGLILGLFILFGVPVNAKKQLNRCNDCGYKWK